MKSEELHIICILAFHLLFLDLSIMFWTVLANIWNNTIIINMGYMYYSIVIKYNITLHVSASFSHPQAVPVSLDQIYICNSVNNINFYMVHFLLLYFLHVWYVGTSWFYSCFPLEIKYIKIDVKTILKVCSNIYKISYVKVVLSANVPFIKLLVNYIS
jgi:hypothetical protein